MQYAALQREDINDISIARGRWLRLRALPPYRGAVEVDDLLEPTMPIWDALETNCVAGCCGFDAFCFWPEALADSCAAMQVDPVAALTQARAALAVGDDDDVVLSTRLNALFLRASLVELVDVLIAGYRAVGDANRTMDRTSR